MTCGLDVRHCQVNRTDIFHTLSVWSNQRGHKPVQYFLHGKLGRLFLFFFIQRLKYQRYLV